MLWLLGFWAYAKADAPLVIMTDNGGVLMDYIAAKDRLAKTGQWVEIKGTCTSACTVLLWPR